MDKDEAGASWQHIVDEELTLAARVREALQAAASSSGRAERLRQESLALRQVAREASEEDFAAAAGALHVQRAGASLLGKQAAPDLDSPYFAHLGIHNGRRRRDIILGDVSFVDTRRDVTLANFKSGLMARVFFQYAQGDYYSEEEDGREVEGVVEVRRLVLCRHGHPVEIDAPEGRLRLGSDGRWRRLPPLAARPRLGTGAGHVRRDSLPVRLDEHQRAAVELPAKGPLLVLGDAGCGKTTVALHRLAALADRSPAWKLAKHTLVVVPERGLARLTSRWLSALSKPDIPVRVFDDWVLDRARRLVPGMPSRICRDAPAAVVRVKRHVALWRAISGHVAALGEELAGRLDRALATGNTISGLLAQEEGGSLLDRLSRIEKRLPKAVPDLSPSAIKAAFAEARGRLARPVEELRLFLGDRTRLESIRAASEGELSPLMVEELLRHVRDQLAEPAEREWAHVEESRRMALDGRGLDEGTPAELAGSVDLEDCAILLELQRALSGPPSASHRALRALVVDEAQDLAPVELGVLADACAKGCAVSVAGDPAQQIDPTLGFHGWDVALGALGLRDETRIVLETSYRCPGAITRLARALRLEDASTPLPAPAEPSEAEILRSSAPTAGHRAALLVEVLRELHDREPWAQTAVICRERETARECHSALSSALDARLVLDGTFSFEPGVDVTTVSEVKGLEFDYVVLPDLSSDAYPATPDSARQLYVALTRTSAQAWLLHLGAPSRLLPRDQT
ncbi:MAG: AAA family ATPase [Polyangia bacterium]|jgi:DNA helicase-2/ATP-dependent DNA helicase PcrA|nr:AAA family ATPase [Polyangia bacterium]